MQLSLHPPSCHHLGSVRSLFFCFAVVALTSLHVFVSLFLSQIVTTRCWIEEHPCFTSVVVSCATTPTTCHHHVIFRPIVFFGCSRTPLLTLTPNPWHSSSSFASLRGSKMRTELAPDGLSCFGNSCHKADGTPKQALSLWTKMSASLGKVTATWARHSKVTVDEVVFTVDGRELLPDETPELLFWQPGQLVILNASLRSSGLARCSATALSG